MTREQYINERNKNSLIPIYDFYLENNKSPEVLNIHEFFHFFSMWEHAQEVVDNLFKYLDVKFEVSKVQDVLTKQIIKFY